jgi:hypothetical protein
MIRLLLRRTLYGRKDNASAGSNTGAGAPAISISCLPERMSECGGDHSSDCLNAQRNGVALPCRNGIDQALSNRRFARSGPFLRPQGLPGRVENGPQKAANIRICYIHFANHPTGMLRYRTHSAARHRQHLSRLSPRISVAQLPDNTLALRFLRYRNSQT